MPTTALVRLLSMPPMVDELVIHCTMPLISDVVPSVTTSDGTRKKMMKSAFTSPTTTPMPITISSTHRMGIPCQTFSTPITDDDSVSVAPTERS